ncbi:hypothetical protein J0H58_30415 [bacterium]|nr:hypothetical protein [bacterium]
MGPRFHNQERLVLIAVVVIVATAAAVAYSRLVRELVADGIERNGFSHLIAVAAAIVFSLALSGVAPGALVWLVDRLRRGSDA